MKHIPFHLQLFYSYFLHKYILQSINVRIYRSEQNIYNQAEFKVKKKKLQKLNNKKKEYSGPMETQKQMWQRERPQTCIHNLLNANLDHIMKEQPRERSKAKKKNILKKQHWCCLLKKGKAYHIRTESRLWSTRYNNS